MSIEQLLFFLFLVAIPLLERLIRALRARTGETPTEHTPAPAEANVSRPRVPVPTPETGDTRSETRGTELPLPGVSLPPALPQAVRRGEPDQLPASKREPRLRREGRRNVPSTLRTGQSAGPGRPGAAPRRIIAGADLRRAIALITILGPCRALEPKDASQPG